MNSQTEFLSVESKSLFLIVVHAGNLRDQVECNLVAYDRVSLVLWVLQNEFSYIVSASWNSTLGSVKNKLQTGVYTCYLLFRILFISHEFMYKRDETLEGLSSLQYFIYVEFLKLILVKLFIRSIRISGVAHNTSIHFNIRILLLLIV